MDQPVELTRKQVDGAPSWDDPQPAFRRYRPGLSPYVHIWLGRERDNPQPVESPLSSQTEAALRDMIERAFGE